MRIFKFILVAFTMLAGTAAIHGAYAHDWQWVVVGASLFGASLIVFAYDRLIVKIPLRGGREVTLDASRSEK